MYSKSVTAKMGRRDVWFLVMLGFFFANTFVILFCHHIVTEHHGTGTIDVAREGNAAASSDMLSVLQEASGGGDHQQQSSSNKHTKQSVDDLPVFAICLLTRDDLPILPEWISYHYHALNLQHLVVAVDPTSETDPKPILDNFRKHLTHKTERNKKTLVIEQWSDADFMPDYFVKGDYGKAPNFVGGEGNPDDQTWEEWYSAKKNFGYRKRRDQTLVNSHRYRQTRFLARCSEHLRDIYGRRNDTSTPRQVWMSTLDSDEYLAVNPWMVRETPSVDESIDRLESGSVLQWLVDSKRRRNRNNARATTANEHGDVCLQVPRLLFGAVELSPNTTTPSKLASDTTHALVRRNVVEGDQKTVVNLFSDLPRHSNKMETLRWKFHAAPNDERNFQQKVILDLLKVPNDDEIWGDHVHTVHRPSRALCAPETDNNANGTLLVPTTATTTTSTITTSNEGNTNASPLVAFHYIGSEEQYFSRPNDFRRNPKRYRERSNITHSRDETGWMDQWLERFVHEVGIATASELLSSYVVDWQETTKRK